MLKRIISLVFIVSVALAASSPLLAQKHFRITGKINDAAWNGARISLNYFDGDRRISTSDTVTDGSYQFEGSVSVPARARLSISTTAEMRAANPLLFYESCEFFIEGGEISVSGNALANASVDAPGKAQLDFLQLQAELKEVKHTENHSYGEMLKASIAKDSVRREAMKKKYDQSKIQAAEIETAFMEAHPDSYVSLDLLNSRINAKLLAENREKASAWFNLLSDRVKANPVAENLAKQIENAYKLGPGMPSPDFQLNDTLGHPVRLSDFKGKYVLLDFWASWCIPCRAENPHIVKAHEKYKNKNFTVLGVSLERPGDRKAWVEAIQKDGLHWHHVAPLKSEERAMISELYGIRSIPMNFLIDPQGKIVAVYLRGEALMHKLDEIFEHTTNTE